MKRRHHQNEREPLDMEQIRLDLQSADEEIRARAVRSICPCHSGWQAFEQVMTIVSELQKDESPLVRGVARHVFEDAAEMESGGYPTNPREASNEMLRTKRASRFPREAEEIVQITADRRRSKGKNAGRS